MKIKKLILYLIVSLFFTAVSEATDKKPDSLILKLNVAQQQGDSLSMLGALHDLAYFYVDNEKFDTAVIFLNRGIRLAESLREEQKLAEMQNWLGIVQMEWGNYQKALDLYLESLLISRRINDSTGISRSYNNIGIIYHDWGEIEVSLDYYQKSYRVDSMLHDLEGQSKTLNNIAILFDEEGEKEKALKYYERALELATLNKDHYMIAVLNGNIGEYYLEDSDVEMAKEYLFRTLEEYKLSTSKSGQADAYILIGDLYKETDEFEAALDYYRQGLNIVLPMNISKSILNAYYSMYEVYLEQNDYKTALEYFSKWHDLQDSIFSIETSTQLATLTNAYEMQQKEQDLELQEARMNEQKARIKRQQVVMLALIGLVILVVVFTLMLMRQYRLRLKAWKQLLVQHEDILQNRQELIKAKEKAEESDRLKTTFLVNVSHELRTPMNGIMGFTDLLQRGDISEDQNKLYLSYIASSSRQLLKVLNDIIDISSIETGQLKLEPESVSINEVMNNLQEYFRKEKDENGKQNIIIKYQPPDSADKHIGSLDRKRFAQVIFNLLSNALRFTKEGSIEFGYDVHKDKMLKIYVKDTGIGIERSNYEIIFERFRQIDDSTTRKHGGSGLGLAISKELVTIMGGNIYLESKLGAGSTFYVELPFTPAEQAHDKKIPQTEK